MPDIKFEVQAGDAFGKLEVFAKQVGLGSIALEHMAVNFTKINSKTGDYITSISGVTSTNQKLTASVAQTAKGIEVLNLKLQETPKAAAAAAKTMANALKIGEAKSARDVLQSGVPTNFLNKDQVNSIQARIGQITSAIERGTVSTKQFQNAVAASVGSIGVDSLTEVEQRILRIIKRIEATSQKAVDKARESSSKAKVQGANALAGQGAVGDLLTNLKPKIDQLNPAALERVKRQFEQLDALFKKGLDRTGFDRALKAIETGTIGSLSKVEAEARHRIERINIELGNVGKGGVLDKLFGDKGSISNIGTSKVIGGLLLAQGVDQAAEKLKVVATNTAEFQKQIALLRTLTQDTDESFQKWSESIIRVSNAVGRSKEEIAGAGYDLLSNQITKGVADTEIALTKASRFATATNSTVQDSVNLLSSVINSFGLDASHTDEILGKLFTTIDLGRVNASDLANTMGRPAVAARSLGLSLDELAAAQITISQTGLGVEQTNTLITNVFHKLLNPTKELQDHFDELGVSTGEMYVKQLGLVGVLEDIINVTGGSSSELAKFFNEIRGEQGITQLTTRIGVLKDALAKLQINNTYGKAVTETTEVAGQRFFVEIQKYTNAFLKFRDVALTALLDVTDSVGGLSNALVAGTYFAGVLGTTLAGLYGLYTFEKLTGQATSLLGVLKSFGPALGGAAIFGTIIGAELGAIYANIQNARHAAEIFAEEGRQNAERQAAGVVASNQKMANANEAQLKKMQGDALAYVAKVKQGLANLATSQKEAFGNVAATIRDNFELVAQALKRVITQGEERERQFVDSIAKTKDRLRDSRTRAGDDLYDARQATNKVRVGLGADDQEGRIQKQRIAELVNEARKLSKGNNPDDIDRAIQIIEKAQAIAQERRNQTVSVPTGNGSNVDILKYIDGNRIANGLIRDREKLIRQADAAQQVALERQRKQNEIDRFEAKKLQDKADKITGFKLLDETGKLNFASPEKALETLERNLKEYQDQAKAIAESQTISPAASEAARKTLAEVQARLVTQIQLYRELNALRIETYRNEEAAQKKGEETAKTFENQISKVRDLKKEMDQAAEEQERFREAALASGKALEVNYGRGPLGGIGKFLSNLGDVDNLGNVKGVTLSDLANKVPEPVQDILGKTTDAINKGNIEYGIDLLDSALVKLKELGATEEEILDKQGNTSTLGKFIKDYRVELNLLINANEKFKAAGIVSDNQVTQAGRMVDLLGKFSENYTSVSAAAERFATVSEGSFKAVNTQANQMVSNLATALRQLQDMTTVAGNLRGVSAELGRGQNPSLGPVDTTRNSIESDLGVIKAQLNELGATSAYLRNQANFVGPPKPQLHGGFVNHFVDGGFLHDFASGKYARGSDRNPTMLADGESVNNARATSRFAAQIIAMNAGFEPSFTGTGKRSDTGQSYAFGDIHVHVKGGDSAAKTTRELGAAMKREIRRGSLNL